MFFQECLLRGFDGVKLIKLRFNFVNLKNCTKPQVHGKQKYRELTLVIYGTELFCWFKNTIFSYFPHMQVAICFSLNILRLTFIKQKHHISNISNLLFGKLIKKWKPEKAGCIPLSLGQGQSGIFIFIKLTQM